MRDGIKLMLNTIIKTAVSAVFITVSMAALAGNLTVSKEMAINASPDTAWKMIGDFNHLDVWHPVVVASQLIKGNSDVAGAVRVLTLGNGATITEKLVANNNLSHRYTYAITESPLPVADYVSTISVAEGMDGKSVVTWSSSFDANGATDEEATNTISGIYDAGLMNLDKHFNK